MKTQNNIFIAFLLNLFFAVFEVAGVFLTGSVAIMSDAIHDFGDAMTIGLAYLFERKSHQEPNQDYTFGYHRYSVLGGLITTLVLISGSIYVIWQASLRLLYPQPVHYDGMILFAIVGVIVNLLAVYQTRQGNSLNQRAVNLHMLEDVLGWIVVLIGAIVMKFTQWTFLDAILSIGVAIFILVNASKTLKNITEIFLIKIPENVTIKEVQQCLINLPGVLDVHHVHVWSIDGHSHCATMHIIYDGVNEVEIKHQVRHQLEQFGIVHVTIEFERKQEQCSMTHCMIHPHLEIGHHHHH